MDPEKFYGSIKKRKFINVEERMKFIKKNPIVVVPSQHLLGETMIWETFPKQDMALSFIKEKGMGLMAYSFESTGESGRRKFVVAHPKIYWDALQTRLPHNRCSYEIIPQEDNCKLYFDLEYLANDRSLGDGPRMTHIFLEIVNFYIHKIFNIQCSRSDILILDSSTSLKFSQHIIYNHKHLVYKNNYEVGELVKFICAQLKSVHSPNLPISNTDLNFLQMKESSGAIKLFCDEGVYTKNRNFRMFGCTKLGKNNPLKLSVDDLYHKSKSLATKDIFLHSLLTYIPHQIAKPLSYGFTPLDKKKVANKSIHYNKVSISSAYPEVDAYISSILEGGFIRSWKYFRETQNILYDIGKNRFCRNVMREHKSNGVMYIVNLQRGVFYQKCHDPDCAGFKSDEWPLPDHTMPWKEIFEENMPENRQPANVTTNDQIELDDASFLAIVEENKL